MPDAGWPQTADQASLSRLSQGAEGAQGHCLLLKVESIFSQNACGAMGVAQVVKPVYFKDHELASYGALLSALKHVM